MLVEIHHQLLSSVFFVRLDDDVYSVDKNCAVKPYIVKYLGTTADKVLLRFLHSLPNADAPVHVVQAIAELIKQGEVDYGKTKG